MSGSERKDVEKGGRRPQERVFWEKNGRPPEDYGLNITTLNRQGSKISHFTKSLSTL